MSAVPSTKRKATKKTAPAGATEADEVDQYIIVNRASFEELFLQCQVCIQRFDRSERKPKTLQCGHVFCSPCLLQLLLGRSVQHLKLRCPSCRSKTVLSKKKINGLPNDFRVAQMQDFMDKAATESQNLCSKHRGQLLNFYCKKCSVPVCRDCTVVDHKESNNHEIVDVHEVLDEHRAQFEVTGKVSKKILMKMKHRSQYLVSAKEHLKKIKESEIKKIDEKFSEYVKELQDRKEALKREIDEKIEGQIDKINIADGFVCEQIKQFQSLYDEFMQSSQGSDVRKLLTLNLDMKNNEAEYRPTADEDDTKLFQPCEFSIEHQNILTYLSDLGSVILEEEPMIPGWLYSQEQLEDFTVSSFDSASAAQGIWHFQGHRKTKKKMIQAF